MKGKLIKKEDVFFLEVKHERLGNIIIASTDHQLSKMINEPHILSLKNCQAIELGYDLDELAYDFSWNYQSDPNYGDTIHVFKEGFQKALELVEHRLSKETEWQVEIVMDICGDKVYAVPEPALDEQGCLILKRL